MARFEIETEAFDKLQQAIENYPDNAEQKINQVLHGEGSAKIQEYIKILMPFSGAHWAGKAPAAKFSKSLTDEHENLSVTVKSTKKYHYLYFPDDGTNTRRHVGNKQFFYKGAEDAQDEIIDRCVERLVNEFEN